MSPVKENSRSAGSTFKAKLLPASALRNSCDPKSLKFKTTSDLPDLEFVIGQPRAIRALELGSEVTGQGYNTFVVGIPGSGRTTLSQEYLKRKAKKQPVPDDWCYVNNFENRRRPSALKLPAGSGVAFRQDIQNLITQCVRGISQQFESEEYILERDRLVKDLKTNQEAEVTRLQNYVGKFNFVIGRSPYGFVLVPASDGKPLTPEDIEKLTSEQRDGINQLQGKLDVELEMTLKRLQELEKIASEKLQELNTRTVSFLLDPLLDILKTKYAGLEAVLKYFETIRTDIIANPQFFKQEKETPTTDYAAMIARKDWQKRYQVNLIVDNSGSEQAPVVVESHPSYTNLIGRIEHEVVLGATKTDFTLIQPGALHKANGGYLVIPARDLLINTYAWEGLKRVLRDGEIRIIDLGVQTGLLSSVTLEPESIPLNIKIFLVGTPLLYYLLHSNDEDFAKLFKVRAEFATTMPRTPETEYEYGLFVNSVVLDNKLSPFDRTAVARIIDYSSRLAGHQEKLTTRFGKIADVIREAAYWSRKQSAQQRQDNSEGSTQVVTGLDVEKAINESIYRSNLIEERIQESITNDTLMIEVTGEAIGQVNALTVIQLSDYSFGHPSRVSATAYAGKGSIADIERQADLGGKIHTKGILILNGLLGERYGRINPINLSASLTFEQSYEEIEGDSASAAEFIALLSAITRIPLRQDIAITGSINQYGGIQAIGGVNKKIEGFFSTCKAKGLTGKQGVIIPASNERNLMLNDEVVEAVRKNRFHIWSIKTIDEGIHLLSGYDPGEPQPDGSYPEDTFNHFVLLGLEELSKDEKGAQDNPSGEENEANTSEEQDIDQE